MSWGRLGPRSLCVEKGAADAGQENSLDLAVLEPHLSLTHAEVHHSCSGRPGNFGSPPGGRRGANPRQPQPGWARRPGHVRPTVKQWSQLSPWRWREKKAMLPFLLTFPAKKERN